MISKNIKSFCHRVEKAQAFIYTSLGLRRCVKGCFFIYTEVYRLKEKGNAFLHYFTKTELLLWGLSVTLIVVAFLIFDRKSILTLVASCIGVTSLIFNAKGNPFGQFLMVVFSVLYGIIAYTFSYYGEMITYLGMTAPMAVCALLSWIRNPYNGNRAEVKVNRLRKKEIVFMIFLTAVVTCIFYGILFAFHTANLIPSTISVTTSFLAVYLTFKRSAFYAAAYAANDVVLILLWMLAARSNIAYLSVVICFVLFLANDIYGLVNWLKMQKRQEAEGALPGKDCWEGHRREKNENGNF